MDYSCLCRLKILKMVPKRRIYHRRTESIMVALLGRREYHEGRKLELGKNKVKNKLI